MLLPHYYIRDRQEVEYDQLWDVSHVEIVHIVYMCLLLLSHPGVWLTCILIHQSGFGTVWDPMTKDDTRSMIRDRKVVSSSYAVSQGTKYTRSNSLVFGPVCWCIHLRQENYHTQEQSKYVPCRNQIQTSKVYSKVTVTTNKIGLGKHVTSFCLCCTTCAVCLFVFVCLHLNLFMCLCVHVHRHEVWRTILWWKNCWMVSEY